MKILKEHDDGSKTILYEPGDRVRVLQIAERDNWLIKANELATVVRYTHPREEPSSISFLDIRTDAMVEGNWGSSSVPPWFLEYAGP